MSLPVRAFSAQVQLPCRVFCGPDSTLELSGTAVSIDTGSLVLAMPVFTSTNDNVAHPQVDQPKLGDKVRLELSLPVSDQNVEQSAGAKYLAVGLKSWGSATMHGKWAMKHHRCKGWS